MTQGQGIIFLQKDKFDFYSPGLAKIIEFRFVPEIIRDLEVVNSELLDNLIKLFVASNKIPPTELIIILSDNTCFMKDFPAIQAQNQNTQQSGQQGSPVTPVQQQAGEIDEKIRDFAENVPFERVATKKFQTAGGTKVLAVNRDFFEVVKGAFEKNGFRINGVYPGLVFGANVSSKPALDIIAVNIILQQQSLTSENNLLVEEKEIRHAFVQEKEEEQSFAVPDQEDKKPAKTDKKRLIAMLSVFAVLIIILIYLVLNPPA
jgi:hypothetical protein